MIYIARTCWLSTQTRRHPGNTEPILGLTQFSYLTNTSISSVSLMYSMWQDCPVLTVASFGSANEPCCVEPEEFYPVALTPHHHEMANLITCLPPTLAPNQSGYCTTEDTVTIAQDLPGQRQQLLEMTVHWLQLSILPSSPPSWLPGLKTFTLAFPNNWTLDFLTKRPQSDRSFRFFGIPHLQGLLLDTSILVKKAQQQLYVLRKVKRAQSVLSDTGEL